MHAARGGSWEREKRAKRVFSSSNEGSVMLPRGLVAKKMRMRAKRASIFEPVSKISIGFGRFRSISIKIQPISMILGQNGPKMADFGQKWGKNGPFWSILSSFWGQNGPENQFLFRTRNFFFGFEICFSVRKMIFQARKSNFFFGPKIDFQAQNEFHFQLQNGSKMISFSMILEVQKSWFLDHFWTKIGRKENAKNEPKNSVFRNGQPLFWTKNSSFCGPFLAPKWC